MKPSTLIVPFGVTVRAAKQEDKTPKLAKNWDDLVRSTDKLVWLFALSNGHRPPAKGS